MHELDGRAWVGLTPFVLGDLRTPVAPASPWFSRFPETNVRTYMVGPDGREGPLVRYRSRRRWPGPVPAASSVTVEVGAALAPGELGQFDHHLTARWQLYTRIGPVLARAGVEHEPWPLHRAVVREPDSALITAGGLPAPEGEPVAHWSPVVRTRISAWRPLGRSGR